MYCLIVSRGALDHHLRDLLYIEATALIRGKNSKRTFNDEDGTGMVKTDGKRGNMGGITGIIFHAEVDWRDKEIHCSYIVRDNDLISEEDVLQGALMWLTDDEDDPADDWKKS